ncbi:MAG: tRNA (guanosine(46)-N7)-methyltransferase TrmB [Candidatus Dadabacteria bacterium]|nr:MAG: tRNA (guanosine(46)-N7)-methyltransferase TrmB [Candidatus Dadabacteria bacterium]
MELASKRECFFPISKPMKFINPYIEKLKEYPHIIFPFYQEEMTEEEAERFQKIKSSYRKIIVELGSGSGKHLIGLAGKDPNTLFVGFELRYKRTYKTALKAARAGISNLIVLRTKAESIRKYFSQNTLDAIYINFPDPWDKKRWKKHRLLTENYLAELKDLMKDDGFLSLRTDHKEYFLTVSEMLSSLSFSVKHVQEGAQHEENHITSEFENLFIYKGLPIFRLVAYPRAPHTGE